MARNSADLAARKGRRWTFFVWIALTIVVAAYLLIAAPFTAYVHEDLWLAAVVVPPLMILLLGIGLGWLIWLSSSRAGSRTDHGTRTSSR